MFDVIQLDVALQKQVHKNLHLQYIMCTYPVMLMIDA